MRVLAAIAAVSAAISGVAAGILAGHAGALLSGHPVGAALAAQPLLPLAAVVLVTAGLPWVLGLDVQVVVGGYLAYLGLAAVLLVPDVPPTYDPPVAVAVVAGAAVGVAVIEIGVRAGTVVAARGTDDTPFGRAWFWPAAAIAAPYLLWNQGLAGRSFLVGVFAAIVGANPLAVWLGRGAAVEATTLVPVAVVGIVWFTAVDATAYVSRGLDGSPYRRIAGGQSSSASDATTQEADSSTDTGRAPPAADADGSMADARARRATTNADAANSAGTGTHASAGEERSADAESSVSAESSTEPPASSADTGADEAPAKPAPCQNCGREHPDREPRFVVTSPACTVVLCPDCESARLADLRAFDECRGPGVQDAVADDDACAACGASQPSLEAHPVVPLDAGGHRHPNNILPLCHGCHVAVEEHRLASNPAGAPRR